MSTISPSKALLSLEQYTPAKVIVDSDLNSWLQTHKKNIVRHTPHKKVIRKYPPKQCFMQCQNIQSLKIKKETLLKLSDTKRKSLSIPSTHAGSAQSSILRGSPQHLAFKQQCNILPLIKISQFNPTQPTDQVYNRKSIGSERPPIKLRQIQQKFGITNPVRNMQQKNRRMTKILSFNRIKNQKQDINSFKKQMINKSVQLNNGKLSVNQRLALNMIARKTQNVQIRYLNMNVQKMQSLSVKA